MYNQKPVTMKTFTHLRWAVLLVLFSFFQAPVNAQLTYTPIYTTKAPLPIYKPSPAPVNWQLKMSTVQVERTNDAGGDRPYFITLYFQTSFRKRGSTRVSFRESEPHDWVSKRTYNRGRLRRGDHMSPGEALGIPFWMGEHEWRNITNKSLGDNLNGMPLYGAIVVALDNNNTPPHAIRNAGHKMADVLRTYLRNEIETGRALPKLLARDTKGIQEDLMEIAMEQISEGDMIATLFDYLVGSLGSPDKLVGLHAFLFPALNDINLQEERGLERNDFNSFSWSYTIGTPRTWNRDLIFENGKARYRVRAMITPTSCSSKTTNRLGFHLHTGNDDLRSDSRIIAEVHVRGLSRPITGTLVNRKTLPNYSDHFAYVDLGRNIPLNAITAVLVRGYMGGSDQWSLQALSVYHYGAGGSGLLFTDQDWPLHKFNKYAPYHTQHFNCSGSVASTPVTPVANTNPAISYLLITCHTGGDDLRGGKDNLNIAVRNKAGQVQTTNNVNGSNKWGNNTAHTVRVAVPAGTRMSDLSRVQLTTTFSGGWNGDNWNLDRLTIIAVAGGQKKQVYSKLGRPLHRFTGDKKTFLAGM